MIYNFIRILLLVLLVVVILVEVPVPPVLSQQINQLLIAILIIAIIVGIDEIIGFLLGLIFLIIYFKYYQGVINNSNGNNNNSRNDLNEPLMNSYNPFNMNNIDRFSDDIKPNHNTRLEEIPSDSQSQKSLNDKTNCITMQYISTELLDKAQNNIYDINNYYSEIRTGENIYGIQGLNSDQLHYVAFDKTSIINNYQ